jgi:hypothetical protein
MVAAGGIHPTGATDNVGDYRPYRIRQNQEAAFITRRTRIGYMMIVREGN